MHRSLFLLIAVALCFAVHSAAATGSSNLFFLSKLSGTPALNGTDVLPLFGNVSMQVNDDTIDFCFATGYAHTLPLRSTQYKEPTRHNLWNMFVSFEFVVNSTSTATLHSKGADGSFKLSLRRTVASSQRFFDMTELLDFDGSNFTTTRIINGKAFATTLVFQRGDSASSGALGCKNGGNDSDLLLRQSKEHIMSRNLPLKPQSKIPSEDELRSYNERRRRFEQLPGPTEQQQQRAAAASSQVAYVVHLNESSWNMETSETARINFFLIGLQGMVNRRAPRLYLIYPPTWAWTDTGAIFDYYNSSDCADLNMSFVALRTLEEVIRTFSADMSSMILYGKQSRYSLLSAYTFAGQTPGAVVVEKKDVSLIALLNSARPPSAPLPVSRDLSTVFLNMTYAASAKWVMATLAADPRLSPSKAYFVMIGGSSGASVHPGVADWAVAKGAVVMDLCTNPDAPAGPGQAERLEEYHVAKNIMAGMAPGWVAMGWHTYRGCDAEHTWTALTSSLGGSVEGLNTHPNFSFNNLIKLGEGDYKFRPNRMRPPTPSSAKSNKKVNIALVQTDGLGLGAWTKKHVLTYTWEAPLIELRLIPRVMRYFFTMAGPSDFFTGCLGGDGYFYPKVASSRAALESMLTRAQARMTQLGLNSFVVFDASSTRGEYTTMAKISLNETLVDAYCSIMANSSFLSGYTNSYDFAVCPKTAQGPPRSFISFDYYLDAARPLAAVSQDIALLAAANPTRPYALAMHVREFNSEARVAEILAATRKAVDFELVSSEYLTELAAMNPTFRTHYS